MKNLRFTLLIFLFISTYFCYGQGLIFYSSEYPIGKRTSYNVFEKVHPSFEDYFSIDFDIQLFPVTEIGYILRIKDDDNNNIFNLFYDGRGDNFFKFNEEGNNTLITFKIDKNNLIDKGWFHMRIKFDLVKDIISLSIDGKTISAKEIGLPNKLTPQIVFGKSDYIIDVPSVAIKNLCISNKQKKYDFPLNQTHGNTVLSNKMKEIGYVLNPKWGINNLYHWQYITSLHSNSVAGTNYNKKNRNIYYYNSDSIFIYNISTKTIAIRRFKKSCPVQLILGTNFIDINSDKLYTYEPFNEKRKDNEPSVASLDLNSYDWEVLSTVQLPQQLHHHGAFYDSNSKRYTIYGGFGNMSYSNQLYSFNIDSKSWTKNDSVSGNDFPRYFISMGHYRNNAYLFGGMGNQSGDQTVGRKYIYDLHKFDLKSNKITKLWEIKWKGKDNVVPVKQIIMDNEKYFYTLCYSESISDSYLRLYRFSIKTGDYEILGDSIPIHSDKITTNANLYYDEKLHKLIVTVQEFKDDISSQLKIYTLEFPPVTEQQYADFSKMPSHHYIQYIIACVIIILFFSFLLIKYRRNRFLKMLNSNSGNYSISEIVPRPNSIFLFGDFLVKDRHNKDITYMFTNKQRQALCLILYKSNENGISSKLLGNLLWEDKSPEQMKDSRGVIISHLRRILKELDGVELIYDKGNFKITMTPDFYCDYFQCMEIISTDIIENSFMALLSILKRGKFLSYFNQPMFDSAKDSVDSQLIPILLDGISKFFKKKKYIIALRIIDILFNIDPLNEKAFIYQIKSLKSIRQDNEAHIKYHNFTEEYKNSFGEEFSTSLNDI